LIWSASVGKRGICQREARLKLKKRKLGRFFFPIYVYSTVKLFLRTDASDWPERLFPVIVKITVEAIRPINRLFGRASIIPPPSATFFLLLLLDVVEKKISRFLHSEMR
jgi:hypothetical protein